MAAPATTTRIRTTADWVCSPSGALGAGAARPPAGRMAAEQTVMSFGAPAAWVRKLPIAGDSMLVGRSVAGLRDARFMRVRCRRRPLLLGVYLAFEPMNPAEARRPRD